MPGKGNVQLPLLRKNTEEGNLNIVVAKDWLPAQSVFFSSPASA